MRPVVLQVVNGLDRGGAERVTVDLATRLDRARWDVRLLTVREGAMDEDVVRRGVPLHATGHDFDSRFLAAIRDMRRYMREVRPSVVHTHMIGSDIVGRIAALTTGVPVVLSTQHDELDRPWPYDLYRRITGRRIAATVACSPGVEAFCRETLRIPDDRLFRIDNGVDLERMRPAWKEPGEPIVFGALGGLKPVKGHRVLVEAFARMYQRVPGAVLEIAGEGPEREAVEALRTEHGLTEEVRLVGQVEDAASFLAGVDVFVQPSLSEGLPMALLEAMAARKAVIASAVGSIPEALDEGEAGMLVGPGDPEALADAMEDLATDPARMERYRAAALGRAEARYSLTRMVEAYASLYERLLAEASRDSG
jgi:glycosyltransferase involved in cell wall biosynthesis